MSSIIRRNSLSHRYRLTSSRDYRYVFAQPTRVADSTYTILARTNKHNFPRIGIIVSKKNVPKAVVRNRMKRVVRESFRLHKNLLGSLDIVVICKKNCMFKMNQQLFRSLDKHWHTLSKHV